MMIRRESLPDELYDTPPNVCFVKFVNMRCRACDKMSGWSEVSDDLGVSEDALNWQHDHFDQTGHRNYYEVAASRTTTKVAS